MSVAGHFWTWGPAVADSLRWWHVDHTVPWSTVVDDPDMGPVRLTGLLRHMPDSEDLLVVVHGLGGYADSLYMHRAAQAAVARKMSFLLYNLRGADRNGDDFYHAGQSADITSALASPELARYRRIFVLGYSMGAHIVLHMATDNPDPRLAAVAAICPPLDLDRSATALDRWHLAPYRWAVLWGLKEMAWAVSRRRGDRLLFSRMLGIYTIRRWDEEIVAPRYGFRSAEHYYDAVSVGPRLSRLSVPSLLVLVDQDPMIPPETLIPSLRDPAPNLDVHWLAEGGHVSVSNSADLGLAAPPGLESQALAWLTATARGS